MRHLRVLVVAIVTLGLIALGICQDQPKQTPQKLPPTSGVVYVHGYWTKSGKYVAAHYRKRPSRHVTSMSIKRAIEPPHGRSRPKFRTRHRIKH